MEKVRVRANKVSKDVDGDYSQSLSEHCQTLQVVFFPSESFGNRASSIPAVVMGRGSERGC